MRIVVLRALLFLLCLPSGGILLLKAYGIVDMDWSAKYLFLPSLLLLVLIWLYLFFQKNELSNLLLIGVSGGLLGTFGYDLIRIPFMLMGSRIFVPISMYGLWLTDAGASSPFTDLIGWLYHFSNGITFGIMYGLFMKGRSYWWAILYALLLETIFVVSPFGELFGLTGKPLSLFAAYLGHIVYGYPLGKMVQNTTRTLDTITYFKKSLVISLFTLLAGTVILWNLTYGKSETKKIFVLRGSKINPNILRIDKGENIFFSNETSKNEIFTLPLLNEEISCPAKDSISKTFRTPGIFHIKIKNNSAIKGVFVLCEPVEHFRLNHGN